MNKNQEDRDRHWDKERQTVPSKETVSDDSNTYKVCEDRILKKASQKNFF